MGTSFSFICCYNNKIQLESMLIPSLKIINSIDIGNGSKSQYTHLLIDTNKKGYKSAAQAFNRELAAHYNQLGDILVFCHQDIAFFNQDLWIRAEKEFRKDMNQLLGIAGMPKTGHAVTNSKLLDNDRYLTSVQTKEKKEVESLDECCFMIPKSIYKKLKFDEKICHHWHLYAVDYCYAARIQYGTRSYVLPESIYHKKNAEGSLTTDNHFLKSMWKMTRKYSNCVNRIYAPCYIIPTNIIESILKLSRTFVKNTIKNLFK